MTEENPHDHGKADEHNSGVEADDESTGHDDGHHDHHGHEHGESGTHDHHHHDVESLGVAVLTVTSSRSLDDDDAGDTIVTRVEDAGHEVVTRELVGDDHDTVQGSVHNLAGRADVDCVVTTGGTGVTPDDVTVEAAQRLFEKELPGFGELFRRESYAEVGSMVVATRATAGIADATPVFCLPGSENAASLGADIVVDVAGHLVGLARRADDETDHDEEA
jgi:molybdenum cofactor biosynthesis protein B